MALLVLKDKLLCIVTLMLQCQLVQGFCSELHDEERAMIQKLSSKESLLCINSAQVIRFNGMQTTLSCTRWDRSQVNLSYSRTIELICVCYLVLFLNGSRGKYEDAQAPGFCSEHWISQPPTCWKWGQKCCAFSQGGNIFFSLRGMQYFALLSTPRS